MTREEAAEIILGGDPFIECPSCGGGGFMSHEVGLECKTCIPEADGAGGTGKVFRVGYEEACLTLGIDPPRATWSPKRGLLWRHHDD